MSVDISITKNKENKIKDALKSHFETEIRSDAGICSYLIFPDGTLIGSYAHRDCLDYLVDNGVLSEEEINKWDTDIFNEVFDCIRATDIDTNENYIGLPEKALTNAQYEMLEKWIDNNFSLGRPTLQVTTKFHTDNQTNAFYNYDDIIDDEWPTDYIINKIKKYYATGKLEEDLDLQPVIEDKKYILNEIKEALDYAYNDLVVILDDYLFDFAEGNYLCWIFTVNESGELLELNDRHKLVKDINKSYGDDYNAAETTKYLKSWIDEVKGSSSEFENRGYYVDWLTNFLWGNGASYLEDDDREALEDKFGISFSKYLGEDSSLQEKIVKKGSKWQVQSEKGRNMGTYDTKAEAEKRLQQVHYFKYANEDLDLVAGDFSIPSSHNKNSDRYGHYNYKIEDPELKQRLVDANPHLEKFLDDHYVWYLMAWAKGINDGTTYQGFLNIYEDGAGWNRVHGSYSDGYRPEPDLVKDIVSNSIEEDLDLNALPTDLNVDNVELVDVSPEKFIIKSDTIKEYIRDAVKEVVTQMKIFSNFRSAEDFADEAVEDEIYLCRVINRLSREEKWAITFEGNYLIFPVSDTFAAHIYSNEVTEDELENFVNDMVKLDEDLDLHPVALPDWKKYFYSDWFDVEGASFICWTDITLPQAEQYIERFRDENVWLVAKFDYDEYDWIYVNDGQLMSFDEAYDIFLSTELKPQCEIGLGLYMGSVDDEVHREILNIDDPEWEFDPWDEYTHLGFLHRKNNETNNEVDEDLELIPVGPKEEFTIVHKNDDTHDCKIKINDGAIIADLNKIVTDLDRDFTFDRFLDTMCSFIDSEHEGYVDIFTQYSSLVYELNFYVRGQRVRDFRIILASINNPHIVFGYDEENNSYEQEVNNTQIEIAKQIDALFGIDIVSNWLKEKDAEYDDVQANSVPGYVEDPIINEDLIPIPEKETSTTIIRGGDLDGIVTLGTDAKDFVLDHIKELFPGVSPIHTLMRINDEFIDNYYATWIYVPMDISDAFRSTMSRILFADRSYYVDSSVLEPYLKTIWKEVDYEEMLRKKQAEKQENNEN